MDEATYNLQTKLLRKYRDANLETDPLANLTERESLMSRSLHSHGLIGLDGAGAWYLTDRGRAELTAREAIALARNAGK